MSTPILSILTPAIWSRVGQASRLEHTIRNHDEGGKVEHITVFDNCKRSVGLKRQACLDIARGEYIAFVDDDDEIAPDYVSKILDAIETTRADVITFDQRAHVNHQSARVNFDLANGDNPFIADTVVKRGAWHVNVWKRELVKDCVFPDNSYGEDLVWSLQARNRVKTHHHIDAILHEYHHSAETTAAPPIDTPPR